MAVFSASPNSATVDYHLIHQPQMLTYTFDPNDPVATILALAEESRKPKIYSTLSRSSSVPSSTLRDRDRGRNSRKERAVDQ